MTALTKNSKSLMSTLLDKKVILHDSLSKKTQNILKHLYDEIKTANHYVRGLQEKPNFYKVNITKIEVASQIPKPKTFNASSFQKQVREHIDQHILYSVEYKFSLIDREIVIYFMTEEENTELQIELYNEYVVKILVWLYMVHNESSNKCAKQLTLYFYMTSLKKELPKGDIHILNEMNVNTAFTYTCTLNSEIVVYRKEEWFKVFMHESFHNFALDFSDMNTDECTKEILGIFPVNSEVNLYESYTETWASIMNAVFCSYYLQKEEDNLSEFLSNCEYFIHFERTYSMFQMVKVLQFMGLRYKNLYENKKDSEALRETMYKENTNVFSYYIIRAILLNNVDGFLGWCKENNYSLLSFKKTHKNLMDYCQLIRENYKTKSMLSGVETMEQLMKKLKKKGVSREGGVPFFLSNTRMTICEMG